MRRAALAVALALAVPATAGAAPLSPAAQFAYNTAYAQAGGSGCETVDAQIVPRFDPPAMVAEYSQPGAACFVYLSRDLAGSLAFAKTCRVLVGVIATWHGQPPPETMPPVCFAKELFLLNHPEYLRKRFP